MSKYLYISCEGCAYFQFTLFATGPWSHEPAQLPCSSRISLRALGPASALASSSCRQAFDKPQGALACLSDWQSSAKPRFAGDLAWQRPRQKRDRNLRAPTRREYGFFKRLVSIYFCKNMFFFLILCQYLLCTDMIEFSTLNHIVFFNVLITGHSVYLFSELIHTK